MQSNTENTDHPYLSRCLTTPQGLGPASHHSSLLGEGHTMTRRKWIANKGCREQRNRLPSHAVDGKRSGSRMRFDNGAQRSLEFITRSHLLIPVWLPLSIGRDSSLVTISEE